jgi:hypothetical protein
MRLNTFLTTTSTGCLHAMDYNAISMNNLSLILPSGVSSSNSMSEACMQQDISQPLTAESLSETKSLETSQHGAYDSIQVSLRNT